MARRRIIVTYLMAWLFAIGTALRYLSHSHSHPEQVPPDILWALVVLFAMFFALLLIEPWLTRRSLRYAHVYLVAQTVIVMVVSLMTPGVDFFATLLFAPILQAMLIFPPRIGFRWLVGLTAIMAILMLHGHPFDQGLPLVIIMSMAYLFIGAYAAVTRDAEVAREEAEAAREESQRLLAELQAAHEQLQSYTTQVEELAITSERNRLARDMHDSVTQSLFSLTLFTQAALERAEIGDLDRVKQSLARIANTARMGLKEMRLLVYELRPLALEDEGLVGALQQRLEMVEGRSGMRTRLLVEPEGEVELPAAIEEELYRVAQEALNNTLKHANASSVTVRLAVPPTVTRQNESVEPTGHLVLEVSDDGCGFDPQAVGDKGGLGLTSIRERVEGMGGTLNIISSPGKGTALRVDVHLSDTEKTQ